jgi:single-strand DNA-binding protein
MSQDNQITLRGYLTAEPKLYQKTATAVPVTEIRIGSTPRRLNRETGEWQALPTSYYRVKCWRRLAINAVGSLRKGDMVVVRGRFYTNSWVDSQQRPRSTLEIEADSVGHDLAYGWSHFQRGARPQENRAGVDAGEAARQDAGSPGLGDGDDEFPPGFDADDAFDGALDPEGRDAAGYMNGSRAAGSAADGWAVNGRAADGGAVGGGAIDGAEADGLAIGETVTGAPSGASDGPDAVGDGLTATGGTDVDPGPSGDMALAEAEGEAEGEAEAEARVAEAVPF